MVPFPELSEGMTAGALAAEQDEQYMQMIVEADALMRRGKRVSAHAIFDEALERHPEGSAALSQLAVLELFEREFELSHQLASAAVTADPENSQGWIALGAAYDGLLDRRSASVAYRLCSRLGKGAYVVECRLLVGRSFSPREIALRVQRAQ